MEYVVTTERSFDEIESRTIGALERHGLLVQRTFSLRSAVGAGSMASQKPSAPAGAEPGYSVLMLYAAGALRRPLGLITLFQRGDRTIISPVLTLNEDQQRLAVDPEQPVAGAGSDLNAQLLAVLVQGGLEIRTEADATDRGLDPGMVSVETGPQARLVRDPVCGKWLEPGRSEANIQYGGEVYHLCCSLCRDMFEGEPERYAGSR
jgi:YHS domain-containing protein